MRTQLNFTKPFIAKLRKKLLAKNKAFQKLLSAEKRVRIAREVIAQVTSGKLKPKSRYLELAPKHRNKINRNRSTYPLEKEADVNTLDLSLVTAQVSCTVCGIGSLFVAAVELADDAPLYDYNYGESLYRQHLTPYLGQWFSGYQLDLIEGYFEKGYANEWPHPPSDHPLVKIRNRGERLIAIMKNIIKNKGTFVP